MLNKTETIKVYAGHIIHCHDVDSGDEFNIEVGIREGLSDDDIHAACINAAKKNELVSLSGNFFEFEYIQPSGRRTQYTYIKEELSPINKESEEILKQREMY